MNDPLFNKMFFVIIRPLPTLFSGKDKTIRPGDCEILLETDASSGRIFQACRKSLPTVHCNFQSETAKKQAIAGYIHENIFKPGLSGGLKIKKIISVKLTKSINSSENANQPVFFYVVPICVKQDAAFSNMKFYLLLSVLNEMIAHEDLYNKETILVLQGLESWLKKQYMRPFGLFALFRAPALERIHENITNPAYASEPNRDWLLLENSLSPDQAMNRMEEANQVEVFISNPMFGTDLNPYSKVDFLIVNSFFGQETPDYAQLSIPNRDQWYKGYDTAEENPELSWVEEFPAHRAAADGDVSGLLHFIETEPGIVGMWDHDGWAPAHYACWYGRIDSLKILLSKGSCDPNLCNRNATSLLHLAAGCGHASIVKLLIEHPYLDRHALDKQGRSAIECCEQIRSKDWHKCMNLLKELAHKNYQKLVVHKMDQSESAVELCRGSNSKVSDVLTSLNFSFETRKYFALWITSKSLHLQLKLEHSPLVEIDKWPEILRQLGGIHPEVCHEELPSIVLKRDVRLLPNIEEEVTDLTSIQLLYEEARTQVLRGLYPCSDQVALAMAAIVMRILYGPFDSKKHKPAYFSDEILRQLLPACKLRIRSVNWASKVFVEFKEISESGPGEISQLQLLYLRYCWTQIPTYGSAFFTGYAYATKRDGVENYQRIVPLYIGINHRGLHFIKVETKVLLVSLSYHSLHWKVSDERRLFELRSDDGKVNMLVHTPQAPLVCSLMDKLSQASAPK